VDPATGEVVERYSYTAYGKTTFHNPDGSVKQEQSSSVGNPYYFTGRRLDSETGLYYYRARYYDVDLGRFIGRDPIGYKGGINLYEYVGDSPTNRTDPSGLQYFPYTPPPPWKPDVDKMAAGMKCNPKCGQCRDPKASIQSLLSAAAAHNVDDFPENCGNWVYKFIKPPSGGCYTATNVRWRSPIGVPFTDHWLRHVNIRVTLCDGTVFYLDNGWWGGSDHVNSPGEIPPWWTQDLEGF